MNTEGMEISLAARDAAERLIMEAKGFAHPEAFLAGVILGLASAGTDGSSKEDIAESLSRLMVVVIKTLAVSTVVREQ